MMVAPAAPALAEALCGAAAVWLRVRAGAALDKALGPAAAPDDVRGLRLAGAVRDLVSHALRRAAALDFLLGELLHRPAKAPPRALLAVALAQLLASTYADFTVVDQAVAAARALPSTAAAAGLVNAVLRSYLRRRAALTARITATPVLRYNVPAWWLQRIERDYGCAAAALLAAQIEEPPMVLRVNRRRSSPAAALAALGAAGLAARRVGPWALWLERPMAVARIPGFAAGLLSVQDAGAQMAALYLDLADGMRVLDACAAPGGKTAHIREIAACRLDAVEVDAGRVQRIHDNLRRLGLDGAGVQVHHADALQPQAYWDGKPYDRILLDAPCTASGVVRRHPDVVLLRREADVAKLATQQAKMLQTLWPLLAPAGRLLYVVCSVFAEEGQRQVSAFLQREPGARQLWLPGAGPVGLQLLPSPRATASSGAEFAADGAGTALPVLHDGFFYALLEKS